MITFKEYVIRRDETSFNPMPYGGEGLAQTALGIAASPFALASGLGQLMPSAKGYAAFEPARDFLLDLNKSNPEWREYLNWLVDAATNYITTQKPQTIQGVNMGYRPGLIGKAFQAGKKLLSAAYVGGRNVVHTIGNIKTAKKDKVMPKVQEFLYGLDTIEPQAALSRLQEFKQRLAASQGSDSIDQDARVHKPFSIFGK